MKEFPCRYFDGLSPVEKTGEVSVDQNNLIVQLSNGETLTIPISNILEICKMDRNYKVVLKGENNYYSGSIICESTEFIHSIREKKSLWFQFFKNTQGWQKGDDIVKKLIPVILVSGVLVVVILKLFSLTYLWVPKSFDNRIGEMASKDFEKNLTVCKSPELQKTLNRILNEVKPAKSKYKYRITAIKGDVINAFALPGGPIYVYSGLLRKTDTPEEVLAVIGHEVTHVEKRHGVRNIIKQSGISLMLSSLGGKDATVNATNQIFKFAGLLAILKYSRAFEEEADRGAVKILHKQGYSVNPMITLFKKLKSSLPNEPRQLTWLSNHPGTSDRIKTLEKVVKKEDGKKRKRFVVKDWRWVRKLCN